jgi:hypothetical protein
MTKKRNGHETPTKPTPEAMTDSWLLDLVDDPETDLTLSKRAVEDAVRRDGMSREEAERLFMPPPPDPPVDVDDLCRMAADILSGRSGPHVQTTAGRAAWSSLARQIEEIEAQGGIVEIPNP